MPKRLSQIDRAIAVLEQEIDARVHAVEVLKGQRDGAQPATNRRLNTAEAHRVAPGFLPTPEEEAAARGDA